MGDAILETPGAPIVFITCAAPNADISTPADVRGALAKLLRDYDSNIGAAAIVFEATGFKATVVRSIVTAINLASRNTFPSKVFASTNEAAQWLRETLGEHCLPTETLVKLFSDRAL